MPSDRYKTGHRLSCAPIRVSKMIVLLSNWCRGSTVLPWTSPSYEHFVQIFLPTPCTDSPTDTVHRFSYRHLAQMSLFTPRTDFPINSSQATQRKSQGTYHHTPLSLHTELAHCARDEDDGNDESWIIPHAARLLVHDTVHGSPRKVHRPANVSPPGNLTQA